MLDKLVSHVSPRVGKMQFEHYFQLLFSGRFRNFDYDHMNSVHYNSKTPPNYKINLIKASMFLYHAEGDLLLSRVVSMFTQFYYNQLIWIYCRMLNTYEIVFRM